MGPETSGIGSQIAKEANVLCAILPSYGKCGLLTHATDKQQLDKGYAELHWLDSPFVSFCHNYV